MSLGDRDKRIAYSIVRHLQSQISSGSLSQDGKEGVESKFGKGVIGYCVCIEWCMYVWACGGSMCVMCACAHV